MIQLQVGGFQISFSIFTPKRREDFHVDEHLFSNGLV